MKNIRSLTEELSYIQDMKIVSATEEVLGKEKKKDDRNFIIAIILFISSILGYAFIGVGFISLSVIASALAIGGAIRNTKMINSVDKIIESKNNVLVTSEYEEINEIIEKVKNKKYDSQFYTEQYKEFTKGSKSEPFEENERNFLNKADTMFFINDEVRVYYEVYKLPPFKINMEDWDLLFDTLYLMFKSKGIEYEFYNLTSYLLRYTFANSLIEDKKSININDFIDNLNMIKNEYITKEDLEKVIANLKVNIKDKKIVPITKKKTC